MNLIFFLFFILIIKSLSINKHFIIKSNYLDNYADYINSKEGIIYPINPSTSNNNYIFEYKLLKPNISIKIINTGNIEEFDIDSFLVYKPNVKYEDFFSCMNCNENNINGFYTTNDKFYGKNYIIKHNSSPRESFFCLNPTKNPSNFYTDNTKINQK